MLPVFPVKFHGFFQPFGQQGSRPPAGMGGQFGKIGDHIAYFDGLSVLRPGGMDKTAGTASLYNRLNQL